MGRNKIDTASEMNAAMLTTARTLERRTRRTRTAARTGATTPRARYTVAKATHPPVWTKAIRTRLSHDVDTQE